MPTTIVVDGTTITFGDTSGDLTRRAHGGNQDLSQIPGSNIYVGDATALLGHAVGGNDTVSGSIAVGDAFTIGGHARGGGDVVTSFGSPIATAYGDAETMTGAAYGGNDRVSGYAFALASVYGDAAVMSDHAHGGNDTLGAGTSQHGLVLEFGDAREMSGHAVGGDDMLIGAAVSSSRQYGDAQFLSDNVHAGDDTIVGPSLNYMPGAPSGEMYGDGQIISGNVQCGNDSLSAVSNSASLTMYGDGQTISRNVHCGDDTLSGAPAFPDPAYGVVTTMYGDGESLTGNAHAGNDGLISGSGNELMWGDAAVVGPNVTRGKDLFVFAPPNGHDQIMDFQPGKDRIELDGFGFKSFQDVASHFQTTPDGVLISFDANDDILVRGVTAAQLHASDFVLG